MRRVDHHQHVELFRQLELGTVVALLQRRLIVEPDLAHGHHALLVQVARQDVEHRFGQGLVVSLLGIEPDGAVVANTELAGAKTLPADDGGKVIDERAHMGARLPHPEGRLNHRDHAGRRHALVVIRDTRVHVYMRINEFCGHGLLRALRMLALQYSSLS